ncbi:MAG: hypothetical protein IPM47_18760 [Sphingobacteriales bacterium]|nr:MAG: hypothetical protein IPM47_18760 [Sphingobacteriales bacterium]
MSNYPILQKTITNGYIFLLAMFGFMLLHRILGYVGHFGYDDMIYCEYAQQIASHTFSFNDDHFSYRTAISGLVGLSFWLFGVNDAAASTMPLLITFLTAWMVLSAHPNRSAIAVCLSLTLFCLNNWTFFYSDKVMPDSLVAFSTMGAFTSIYRFRYISTNTGLSNAAGHAFVFCAFLLFGFLAKETIWFVVPALAWVFFSDILHKRNVDFWLFSFTIGAILLLIYFGWIWKLTGHPFSRFHAIDGNGYFMPECSFDRLPWKNLIERITYKQFFVFVSGGMIIGIAFAVPSFFRIKFKALYTLADGNVYWLVVSALLFLSGYFWTTSFRHYMPMCPDPRHYLFFIPPAAIVAGTELQRFFKFAENKWFWVILPLVLSAITFFQQQYGILVLIYLPMTLLFGGRSLLPAFRSQQKQSFNSENSKHESGNKSKGFVYWAFAAGFVFIMSGYQVYHIYSAQNNAYSVQKQLIYGFFKPMPHHAVIITNEVQKNFARYYYGFQTGKHTFITFKEAKTYPFKEEVATYILLNGHTQWMSGKGWEHYPDFVKQPPASFEKVEEQKNITVYLVKDLNILKEWQLSK